MSREDARTRLSQKLDVWDQDDLNWDISADAVIDFLLRPEHFHDWLEAFGIDEFKQVRLGLRDLGSVSGAEAKDSTG